MPTLEDVFDAPIYNLTIVLPATVAAPAIVELSALVANGARLAGLHGLAARAAIYGYDIADHDPADSTWELHRRRLPWAYTSTGSFRPHGHDEDELILEPLGDDEPTELSLLETYADAGWPPVVAELARRRGAGERVQPAGLVETLVARGFL